MEYAATRFADDGYHPTSVADVVAGVGVGKGVFYWYFDSKEELLLAILRETHADLRRALREATHEDDSPGGDGDAVVRIEQGIRAFIGWLDANRHLLNLFQFAATDARFAPALRQAQARQFQELSRHVANGVAEGRIRSADPELLTHAVLGVLHELTRTLLEADAPPALVADEAVAFCLGGLLRR